MLIPILIESIDGGRFRVRAGGPWGLTAEGESCVEAKHALEQLIAARLATGVPVGWLDVPNGKAPAPSPLPLPADERYKTDASFAEMQAAIAEFRRAEDEQEERRWQGSASP